MSLDYLYPYRESIEWGELALLKQERDSWWSRPSADHLTSLLGLLPKIDSTFDIHDGAISLVSSQMNEQQKKWVIEQAKELKSWRKGPFDLFGEKLDAEWRSDYKWKRLEPHVSSLEGKVVLDIGCNNGYFMFQMAQQSPEMVLGIDPVLLNAAQFQFINHFAQQDNIHFELWGVEHLPLFHQLFDTIFSMGILYHHRNPMQQLIDMREALKPGGELILETIGIPGDESVALFPEDRYAKMKNVWFLPTLNCLKNMMTRAKFIDIEVISTDWQKEEEQRQTDWNEAPSLTDFLDPQHPSKTIEGYPAPERFCLKAKKKPSQAALNQQS